MFHSLVPEPKLGDRRQRCREAEAAILGRVRNAAVEAASSHEANALAD